MVNALLTSVIDAANDALFIDAVPAAAAIVSILPAKDEDVFENEVFAVDIDAAREELLLVIEVDNPSNLNAAEELLFVIVDDMEFTDAFNEDDAE